MHVSNAFLWNPADYAAHSSSQLAWARELMGTLALHGDERILDVGCGDGKISAELADAVPRGSVLGIDASPEMVAFARQTCVRPNLEFRIMDARQIALAREFDRVFSNATLHWVDDHRAFLRGASHCLRPGGRLAASCGGKGNAQDVFAAFRAEMRSQQWRPYFRSLRKPYFFYGPEDYRNWLPECGFQPTTIRLANKDASFTGSQFAGWLRTTWLPYTQRVPEEARNDFIAAVVERYGLRHPADSSGRYHVWMVRLEIAAVKV